MDVRIVGSNGPYAAVGNACSCYLVKSGGYHVVLDMGNGALARLGQYVDYTDVDAIVLTHLHYDHISDIQIYRYRLQAYARKKIPCKQPMLFLPKSPPEIAKQVAGEYFDVHYIEEGVQYLLGGMQVSFYKMAHPVECYAVKMERRNKVFVYSSDTSENETIHQLAEGADLLLIDGALLESERSPNAPHFSIGQACSVGKAAKRTVITHGNPDHRDEDRERELCFGAVFAVPDDCYTV